VVGIQAGTSESLAWNARYARSGMEDSRGIAAKVGQYPEGLLAIPWFQILLHSRQPSRLAGIWKSHGEGHRVKADDNFSISARIVNFLRTSTELQRHGGTSKGGLSRNAATTMRGTVARCHASNICIPSELCGESGTGIGDPASCLTVPNIPMSRGCVWLEECGGMGTRDLLFFEGPSERRQLHGSVL
jgi:hypothetical protein